MFGDLVGGTYVGNPRIVVSSLENMERGVEYLNIMEKVRATKKASAKIAPEGMRR